MAKSKLNLSYKMPFGRRNSAHSLDINAFYDTISQVSTALESYEPLGKPDGFSHQSAYAGFKDLTLASSVCSPVSYSVTDDDSLYFILPFHGQAKCTIDRKTYTSSLSHGAMIIPGLRRSGATTELSMLQATLKSNRLEATAKAMLGEEYSTAVEARFNSPHLLPMEFSSLRFDQLFWKICGAIDDCGLQADLMNALGLEDTFYRTVVAMVLPDQFVKEPPKEKRSNQSSIDRVCDYIDAHLADSIYLTDLERFSNMSARSLQYAFLKRFGCTPTEWIRMRRLGLARQRLMASNPSGNVTRIAHDCGFASASDFSRHYIKQYGESPSATLKKTTR